MGMVMRNLGNKLAAPALAAAVFFVACAPEAPRQPRFSAPTPTPYVLAVLQRQELAAIFMSGFRTSLAHVSPVLYSEERFGIEEKHILSLAEGAAQKSIDEFVERDNRYRADLQLPGMRATPRNYYEFSPFLVGTRQDDIPVLFMFYYDPRGDLYRIVIDASLNGNLNYANLNGRERVMPAALREFTGRTYAWHMGLNWVRTDLNHESMQELPYALFSGLPPDLDWRVKDWKNEPAPLVREITATSESPDRSVYLRGDSKGSVRYDLTLKGR